MAKRQHSAYRGWEIACTTWVFYMHVDYVIPLIFFIYKSLTNNKNLCILGKLIKKKRLKGKKSKKKKKKLEKKRK